MSAGELHPNYSANLQGLWHLSGLTDSSSNGYNLTNNNAATFVPGKWNNGAKLVSASSQHLNNTSTPNLRIAGSQTWIAWIKPATVNTTARWATLSDSGPTNYVSLTINGTDISMEISGLTPGNVVSSVPAAIEQWFGIVCVYDSTDAVLKTWVNGILTKASVTGTHTAGTGNFSIGKFGDGASGAFPSGIIDEMAIYSRAWSDVEVKNYYAWALGVRTSTA